jgi:hypothetical protein
MSSSAASEDRVRRLGQSLIDMYIYSIYDQRGSTEEMPENAHFPFRRQPLTATSSDRHHFSTKVKLALKATRACAQFDVGRFAC